MSTYRRPPRVTLMVALTLLLGVFPLVSRAQDLGQLSLDYMRSLEGTVSTTAQRLTVAGQLRGCTVEYRSIIVDQRYRRGGISVVVGSITMLLIEGQGQAQRQIGIGLKVVVKDATVRRGDPNPQFVDSRPHFAYLETPSGHNNASSSVGSGDTDPPGGIYMMFPLDESFAEVYRAMLQGTIIVAFNRTKGGVDLKVPIDLRVVDLSETGQRVRSQQTIEKFAECSKALIDRI